MTNRNSFFKWAILGTLLLTVACEKDKDNAPNNEQELITTVRLRFTNGSNTLVFNARDTDGDGGLAPVIDPIRLAPNTPYNLEVSFWDESKTPAVELTAEVRNEGTDHLICLTASGALPDPINPDKDANGKPLGLNSQLTTAATGNGTLKVILKHLPNKLGTAPCSTGETDVETTFQVTIAN